MMTYQFVQRNTSSLLSDTRNSAKTLQNFRNDLYHKSVYQYCFLHVKKSIGITSVKQLTNFTANVHKYSSTLTEHSPEKERNTDGANIIF